MPLKAKNNWLFSATPPKQVAIRVAVAMQSSVVVEAAGHAAKKKIVSMIFMHSNVGYFLKTVVVLRQSWNAVGYDGWSVLESVCVVKK